MKTRSPQSTPPPGGDVSIQSATLVCIWVLFGLSGVVVALRILTQCWILRRICWDDGLIFIAWILQGVSSALCTVSIAHGIGRHEYFLTTPEYTDALKYHIIGMPFGMLSAMFARISAAVFLLLLVTAVSKVRKYVLWVLIGAQIIFNIVPIIVTFVLCRSYINSRDPSVSSTCWSSSPVAGLEYLQGAINIVSDLGLSLLGLTQMLSLTLRTRTKIALLVVLSLSLVATVATIFKSVVLSTSFDGMDRTYYLARWNYWYSIENAAIIIATSLPIIWSLFSPICHMYSTSMERLRRRRNNGADVESGQSSSKYLHVRNISDSTGKESGTRLHDLLISGTTDPGGKPQGTQTQSIYNLPRRDRCHRYNLSDSFALSSLSRSSKRQRNMSRCSSANDLHAGLAKDFVPCSSPRLTSHTVVSGGCPLPPSVPPSVLSSLTPSGSGRTSRNSFREDPQQDRASPPPPMRFHVEGRDSPILASGPSCIRQTNHFTVEYEDATGNNPGPDVDLGWTVMRNDDLQNATTTDNGEHRYSESEANGLQLHDVGSILTDGPQRDHGQFSLE